MPQQRLIEAGPVLKHQKVSFPSADLIAARRLGAGSSLQEISFHRQAILGEGGRGGRGASPTAADFPSEQSASRRGERR